MVMSGSTTTIPVASGVDLSEGAEILSSAVQPDDARAVHASRAGAKSERAIAFSFVGTRDARESGALDSGADQHIRVGRCAPGDTIVHAMAQNRTLSGAPSTGPLEVPIGPQRAPRGATRTCKTWAAEAA